MDTTASELNHGFRVDPLTFVDHGTGLEAALVRKFVIGRPKPEDEQFVKAEIDKILALRREDGALAENAKDTGAHLLRLLTLGADPRRDEIRRAAEAILKQTRDKKIANEWYERDGEVLSIYALHALCLLGRGEDPEVTRSLRLLVEHQEVWNDPWKGCPWTPEVFWSALWAGREIAPNVKATVNEGLRRVTEQTNAAGCCGYNDPWGFVEAAGQINSEDAATLLHKQLPLILHGQQLDGGWGARSFSVFRALKQHGLFERLKGHPPVPADWTVVREVALPEGKWTSLAWDGRHFWSIDAASQSAVALSPANGREEMRVKIDHGEALGWWDRGLFVLSTKAKELRKIDVEIGEVEQTVKLDGAETPVSVARLGDRILVGDGFLCCVHILETRSPKEPRQQTLGGPSPLHLAVEGNTVWHADSWAPAIIRSDLEGRLLDWGGAPFDVKGLAFDGQHLWALDGERCRICRIERTTSTQCGNT